jgi:putative transposase
MRPSRFSESEMLQAIRQVRGGSPAVGVCRSLGITETTFYRWRKKYEAVVADEPRGMRGLRDENRKLKLIVADLLLEKTR